MRTSVMTLLAATLTLLAAWPMTGAAQTPVIAGTRLTLYPGDGEGAPALVQQTRRFDLHGGMQTLWLDGLAQRLDAAALLLRFPAGSGVHLAGMEVPPAADGLQALLTQALGKPVQVLSEQGQVVASGTLRGIENGLLLVQQDDGTLRLAAGTIVLPAGMASPEPGARVRLRVDAARAGSYTAQLLYPTAGLGWRADYALLLAAGDGCRATLETRATLVNHSGTDFRDARVTLVAGNVRQPENMAMPRLMMAAEAALPAPAAPGLPAQGDLAGYRRYTLPQPLTLANGASVLTPLEAPAALDCTRALVLGQRQAPAYAPPKPFFIPGPAAEALGAPRIQIGLRAPHNLPTGNVRVYQPDAAGTLQFIGGDTLPNLRRDDAVRLTIGDAYQLRAERTRTVWHLAGDVLTEGLRVHFSNRAARAEAVTLYVHPDRWRDWHLVSSSLRPQRQGPDTLVWRVQVPARGAATLDYTLRYDAAKRGHPAGETP